MADAPNSKQLLEETQTSHDGYPFYCRRKPENGGCTAKVAVPGCNKVKIDNRWIVPYSLLLCNIFDANINVEYCNLVKSINLLVIV